MMPRILTQTARPTQRRWAILLIAAGLLAGIWLTLLPAIARQPRVAERIHRLDERGIDPTAIFYSELPGMPAAEATIERARAADNDPLW